MVGELRVDGEAERRVERLRALQVGHRQVDEHRGHGGLLRGSVAWRDHTCKKQVTGSRAPGVSLRTAAPRGRARRPATRNTAPASGSGSSRSSRDVVTNRSRPSSPPSVQAVVSRTGTVISASTSRVGREAPHEAGTVERHPDVARGVDAQPVGSAGRRGRGTGGGRAARRRRRRTRRSGPWPCRCRTRACRRARRRSVGDGRVGDDHGDLARRGDAVEGCGARRLVVGHGPGVEVAGRVAAALVHADARVRPQLRPGDGHVVGPVRERDAPLEPDDVAAAGARPDERGDLPHVQAVDGPVAAQGEQVAREHVDPAQAAPDGRPARAFGVVGEGVGELLGADHRAIVAQDSSAGERSGSDAWVARGRIPVVSR